MKKNKPIVSIVDQVVFSFSNFALIFIMAKSGDYKYLSEYNEFIIFSTFLLMANASGAITPLNSLTNNKSIYLSEEDVKKTTFFISMMLAILSIPLGFLLFKDSFFIFAFLTPCLVIRDYSRKYIFYNEGLKEISIALLVAVLSIGFAIPLYLINKISAISMILVTTIPSSFTLIYLLFFRYSHTRGQIKLRSVSKFVTWQLMSSFLLWGGVNIYLIVSSLQLNEEQNSSARLLLTIGSIFGVAILSLESFLPKYLNKVMNYRIENKIMAIFFSIAVFVLILVFCIHKELYIFLIGNVDVDNSFAIFLVVLWQSLSLLSYVMQISLRRNLKTNIITCAYFVFFVSSLFLSSFLISKYEVLGIFFGIVISQIMYFLVVLYFYIYYRFLIEKNYSH